MSGNSNGLPVPKLRWLSDVAPHDYEAALNYLTLRLDPKSALKVIKELRKAKLEDRRANDILRACDREPLGLDDLGVRKNFDKTFAGQRLSPVLVVTFNFGGDIADGYHRVSWAYQVSPYTMVPCKVAYVERP